VPNKKEDIKRSYERLRRDTTTLYTENPYMIKGTGSNQNSTEEILHVLMPVNQV